MNLNLYTWLRSERTVLIATLVALLMILGARWWYVHDPALFAAWLAQFGF